MADSATPIDFRKLFRQLPENYLLLAPDGTVLDNTDSHVQVSMLPREQAVGRNIFEAFPSAPESQQALAESHQHVRDHLVPHTMPLTRYDLARPDSGGVEERYWKITHYPLLNEQGELEYILQCPQNVTDQHLAELRNQTMERELAETEERSRFVLESLPVMVWTTRADGYSDYFSQRWLQFTGKPMAAETGSGWLDGVHPDDREKANATWLRACEMRQHYQTEYRLRNADGQYRWVLARGVPRLDAAGEVTMWVGCCTDIHDQKIMVQELLMANEEQATLSDQAYKAYELARTQRETFYTLFQQAPALIAIVRGEQHVYEFVNPRYQEIFADRQLLGLPVATAVPEAQEQGFINLLDNVYRTGEPFFGKEILLRLHRRDTGQEEDVYFDFTYQAFRENGQIAGIFGFAFDVTELVLTRKELERISGSSFSAVS